MNEAAYPLSWPKGQKRTALEDRIYKAPFTSTEHYEREVRTWNGTQSQTHKVAAQRGKAVSVPLATERLETELSRLDASHPVLSTNLELRLNGMPRGGQKDPDDSGAAVWFTLKEKRIVLACDKWARVADNIAALAAHIRSLRSIENFGVGSLEQAFRGYQALPPPGHVHPWREILGPCSSLEDAIRQYRERAKRLHPDAGGNQVQMAELNLAMKHAREEFGAAA